MVRDSQRKRAAVVVVAASCALLLASGCTRTSRDALQADRLGDTDGYSIENISTGSAQHELRHNPALPRRYFILTFSGGGTRAAALAHGVLRELGATPAPEVTGMTLLDGVDMISSTSGGSVAATNFVLHGPDKYGRLHETGGFLHHGGMADIILAALNPINAANFTLTSASRIETLSDMFRRKVTDNATFADLLAQKDSRHVPLLILNAADMATGERFSFTQRQLDRLCLNLRDIRLDDATAASAAYPVALTPLPLPIRSPCVPHVLEAARGGLCGQLGSDTDVRSCHVLQDFMLEARMDDSCGAAGGRSPILFSDTFQSTPRGMRQWHLLNLDACGNELPAEQRMSFVHLIDGGAADNLGLAAPLETLTAGNILTKALEAGRIEEVVIISVNARSQGELAIGRDGATPGIFSMAWNSIGTAIDNRSGGLLAQLDTLETLFRDRYRRFGDKAPKVRSIAVDFERIADPKCRADFQNVSTNWSLKDHQIDALQQVASAMLRADPHYRKLVGASEDPKVGLDRARSACQRVIDRHYKGELMFGE